MSLIPGQTKIALINMPLKGLACGLMALLVFLCAGMLHAAGLGRLNVQSHIGQPLSAEIELINVGRDDLSSLKVGLASTAAYRAAGLTFDPALNALRLTLERRANGTPYIRAAGTRRVAEPYLDLLVDLSTPDGGIQRAYTVLLDLPDALDSTASAAASAPVAAAPAAGLDAAPLPPREPRPAPARKTPATNVATVPAPALAAPPLAPIDTRAPAEKPRAETPKPVVAPVTPTPAEPPKAEPPVPAAKEPAPPVSAQSTEPAAAAPTVPSSASSSSPSPAPAPKKAALPPPQKAQQSTTTGRTNSYTAWIVGIALALVAGIGSWWALAASRRRREAEAGEFIAVEPAVEPSDTQSAATAEGGTIGAQQSISRATVPAVATVSNVTDMVDPIDEARVYLEHSQDEPAEKLLREALSQQPGREDLQMLLLEILGKRGDKDGFNQLAGRLHKQTGGAGECWKHVMAMGYALDPSYPLYSPTDGSAPEQAAPAATPEGIDFDLGLSATTNTGTATDINLNTPVAGADSPATDIFLDDGSARKDIDKTLA